jgi:peptide/nickel transport system substrate-binding protein
MRYVRGLAATPLVLMISIFTVVLGTSPEGRADVPADQMTWAVHISLAPTWFDPAETSGIITPYMLLYALHDALVKPMPGHPMAPSLAESWSVSPDGLVYEFFLRRGAKFHNGDPVTAEDVKFSFERYRGVAHRPLKESVALVRRRTRGVFASASSGRGRTS